MSLQCKLQWKAGQLHVPCRTIPVGNQQTHGTWLCRGCCTLWKRFCIYKCQRRVQMGCALTSLAGVCCLTYRTSPILSVALTECCLWLCSVHSLLGGKDAIDVVRSKPISERAAADIYHLNFLIRQWREFKACVAFVVVFFDLMCLLL